MKKILSIIFMAGIVTVTHAQLLVTDSSFATSFFGGPLALTGTDSSYHDASNCRVAYRYSKRVATPGGPLQNSTYTTYDYYPIGTLRQTVEQSWDVGTSTYVNTSRSTTTYYQSTTALSTLAESWVGSAWQNASLDSNVYDGNGFHIKNINQSWNGTMWSTTDSTIYYNTVAGLADSSITQEFDANHAPTDKSKQIYTYLNGTSLVSQQVHQTLVNNQWQDSSRYTFYYSVNNRIDSLHGEFYDPGTQTFILAARIVNQYNAANQVIVTTQYVVYPPVNFTTQTRFNYIPCNVLPVTLLDFKAEKQKNEVLLRWSTSSESNTSYFDIQRSTDNVNFISVGRKAAAGNSNTRLSYEFTDNVGSVTSSKYIFYRLRQVDKDDKFSISPIVFVTVSSSGQISIAPNPARDHVNILHDNSINLTNSFITITDISGKTLLRQKFRDESIPLSSFGKGVYVIKITSASGTITRKLVVE
jgi:hypothetical protein